MTKYKIILSFLTFFLMSDMHSKTMNIPPCDASKEECLTYEYFGDTNRNGKAHGEGKMVWERGMETEGRWVNGDLAEGKTTESDGSSYEGAYKNYNPHGYGEKYWSTGSSYKGLWKNGKRHGNGVYVFAQSAEGDGDGVWIKEYKGQWAENEMTGKASVTYTDGSKYKGQFVEGERDGYGEYTYADGKTTYKGGWKANKVHGVGVHNNHDGLKEEGSWNNGEKEGYFKINYVNGSFEGFYKKGKRNGQGKSNFPDGSSYEGNYINEMFDGWGRRIFPDGNILQGTFKENVLVSGLKIIKRVNTTFRYSGTFNKNYLEGEGTLVITLDDQPDTSRTIWYSKNFKKDTPTGPGIKQWFEYIGGGEELYLFNYFGDLVKGQMDGYGEMHAIIASDIRDVKDLAIISLNADFTEIYRGEFKKDKFEGQGVFTEDLGFKDFKKITTGNFRNGGPHGKASFRAENKKDRVILFEGNFVDSIRQGYGEERNYSEKFNASYKGDFKNGKKWGKGVLTVIDNASNTKRIYEGNFNENTQLDGYGSITYSSGAKDSGLFENGGLVEGTMTGALGVKFDSGLEPFVIESFFDESPGLDSGLLIGDKILAIKAGNNEWIDFENKAQWTQLRQKNNSQLEIKIQRKIGNSTEEKIFQVTNKTIKVNRVVDIAEADDIPRVALIIGNSNYQSSKLDNPINDAELMKKSLENKGFQTILKLDTSKEDFKKAVWEFGDLIEELGPKTTALFYYSGHGMQANGKNYLIPLGSRIRRLREVETEAIAADEVMNALAIAERGIKIMILDACRDNPFRSFTRNNQQGLAEMDSPTGTIIAYSTAPGRTALDGGFDLGNSIYTKSLAESMDVYDLKIEEVFKRTRREVEDVTDGDQVPWESSSLLGDFYFNQFD